ncbi:MAG: class I SAM-dependent methyltransferase [Verrucomicrobiota bacterium]
MKCLLLPSYHFSPQVRVPSTWLENFAFGYDLIHFLKPKTVVELGVFWGGSFFVFCQAVKASGSSTICHAIDTWQGDSQAGQLEEETYQNFMKHRDAHFSDISKVMRMPFEQALSSFPEGSIDLLHIDGFHTYEAVKHDYETWLPKVSKTGVILFHDVKVVNEAQNFGVKRFWEEIKKDKLHFEMENEFGLGVLYQGKEIPAQNEFLKTLFQGSAEEKEELNRYYLFMKERFVAREFVQMYYKADAKVKSLEARLADLESKIRRKEWNKTGE